MMCVNIVPQNLNAERIEITPQGDLRTVWKLKGTDKNRRADTILSCTRGQPVFVICNSNGSNCAVITETGEELGRLKKRDAELFHRFVEHHRARFYIKDISGERSKPKVHILVYIRKSDLEQYVR